MNRRACCATLCRGICLLSLPLAGCISSPAQLVKSDIDRIADLHRREIDAGLLRLAEKLYRRNPREWAKGGQIGLAAALERLAAEPPPPPDALRSTARLLAGMREDYAGDRVAAFIGGLLQMMQDAFGGRREFFIPDAIDPQALYNAARNLEIAAWKLANARRTAAQGDLAAGTPLLLSNELTPLHNLSFEREFGRLIGNLDLLVQIVADKTQRTVVKLVQNFATAFFLPIP